MYSVGAAGLALEDVRIIGEGPDWVGIVTTCVTLLAVVVALFGPMLHRRWTRPHLTVSTRDVAAEMANAIYYDDLTGPPENVLPGQVAIEIHNRANKERAQEVEVYVSAVSRGSGAGIVIAEARMPFLPTRDFVASVPAGFQRSVLIADLDPSPGHFYPEIGRFLFEERETPILGPDREWDLALTVTGSNFNAVSFEGRVRLSCDVIESVVQSIGDDRPDDMSSERQVFTLRAFAQWTVAPKRLTGTRRRTLLIDRH